MLDKLFGKVYNGRGINIYVLVSPRFTKPKWTKLRKELIKIKQLKNHFKSCEITRKHKEEDNREWFRIHCPFADFSLKKSEIGAVYGQLYAGIMIQIREIVKKNGFKMEGFSFEIKWFNPEPKEMRLIPEFKLDLPEFKLD